MGLSVSFAFVALVFQLDELHLAEIVAIEDRGIAHRRLVITECGVANSIILIWNGERN